MSEAMHDIVVKEIPNLLKKLIDSSQSQASSKNAIPSGHILAEDTIHPHVQPMHQVLHGQHMLNIPHTVQLMQFMPQMQPMPFPQLMLQMQPMPPPQVMPQMQPTQMQPMPPLQAMPQM
ncbi:hypothetical protein Taro_051262 [Colocasia esculenta]|uniref:Uncharacterized protein n=1 Tax=Colocasia esculenta TaxID=4460 RepID=A0A843XGB0_COLES|nr:hypothetical protein [Colocasia esculenta]